MAEKKKESVAIEAIGGKSLDLSQSHEMTAIAVAAAAKAQVEARFLVALHRPRHFDVARQRVLESCQRPGFADKAIYRKPQGNKKDENGNWVENFITGMSIRFAEEMMRTWGNIDIASEIIYDDDERVIIKVVATDLETNCTQSDTAVVTKRVERRGEYQKDAKAPPRPPKGREVLGARLNSYGETSYIVRATDDEVQVKCGAAKSKLIRNCGLRLIPGDVLEEARAACEATTMKEARDNLPATRAKMVEAFSKLEPSVSADELSRYLGHLVMQATATEVTALKQIYAAVRDGAKWTEIVAAKLDERAPEPQTAPPAPGEQAPQKPASEQTVDVKATPAPKAEKKPEPAKTPAPAKDVAARAATAPVDEQLAQAEKKPEAEPCHAQGCSAPSTTEVEGVPLCAEHGKNQATDVKKEPAPITAENPATEPEMKTDAFADWLIAQIKRADSIPNLNRLAGRKMQCPESRWPEVLAAWHARKAELTPAG